MDAAEKLSSERFEVVRPLGKGGMGIVYEAIDRETQTHIALKTLLNPSPEQLYWLKNEFRKITDLQHPNLVQIAGLHYEDGVFFISMELIRGQDFRTHVRGENTPARDDATGTMTHMASGTELGGESSRSYMFTPHSGKEERAEAPRVIPAYLRPTGGFDETKLRDATRQLAEGVCALHAMGVVHRDLKPGNVMVEAGGRVVLLDFGLAETLQDDALTKGDGVARGTAAFMAPEQVDGDGADEALDWYAFGVMLFDGLTGRLPFEGTSERILASKRAFDAPRPSDFVRDLPADLEALCVALLSRDPSARPSGQEVLRRLSGGDDVKSPRSKSTHIFIGRETELSVLDTALVDVRAGRFAAVLVDGEPGVGKTELVDHFFATRLNKEPDIVLLRGRCYEQEFIPFKGLDTIVDGLASYLQRRDDAEVSAMLPLRLNAVAALFPALYRIPAVARVVPPPSAQELKLEQREAAFTELTLLVRALSRELRLVLFLDDLQWAGGDSEALLLALFGNSAPPPVLLIATRRTTDAWEGLATDGSASPKSPSERFFRLLTLKHLSKDESAALVHELWPAASTQHTPAELENFLTEAGGHPLFLQEMARHASQGGTVRHDLRLDQVLRERIRQVPREARALLEVSAVAGVPLPARVLARVAAVSRADSARMLRMLRAEQLVRTGSSGEARTVEAYHDRIREAIVDALASGEYVLTAAQSLPAVHLALGRQLQRARDEQVFDAPLSTIANHYNQGVLAFESLDDVRIAAKLNIAAMKQVKSATAFEAAERYLAEARGYAEKLEDGESRVLRRQLDFEEMELAHLMNDRARMEALFAGLVGDSRNDTELADAYDSKIALLSARSLHVEALGEARECLARLGCHIAAKGRDSVLLRDVAKLEFELRGRELSIVLDLPELRDERSRAQMRILMAMTPGAYFTDSTLMCIAMVRIAHISLKSGLTDFSAYGFAAYAMVLAGAFRMYGRAFKFSQLSLALNERFKNHTLNTKLPFLCGIFTAPYQRPFEDAHAYLTLAREQGLAIGDLNWMAYSAVSVPMVTLCAGKQLSVAGSESEAAARDAERVAALDMSFVARWQVRMVRCLEGTTANPLVMDASTSTEESFKNETLGHHPMASFYYALNKSLLAYHFGDRPIAEEWVEKAAGFAFAQFGLLSIVDFTFYRMLVSCAALEHARKLGERLRLRLKIALTTLSLRIWARAKPENFGAHYLLARAESSRVTGHLRRAREQFDLTIAEADRLGRHRVTAIAWERLADCHAALGATADVERCRRSAAAAYAAWGAHAKVRALEHKDPLRPAP